MSTKNVGKNISSWGLISLGAGGTIGSSWIYTNSQFFREYGAGGEIFGMLAAAVLAILAALSFAELATIFVRSGGEVVYGYVAFGKPGALFAAWTLLGGYISSLGFYVTASGLLLARIWPQIAQGPGYTFAGMRISFLQLLIGVMITLGVYFLTYRGAKIASQVQILLLLGLVILGLILMIVGFTKGSFHNFWPAFNAHQQPVPAIIRFVIPAMTFLTGWESVAALAEEAQMPAKKIGLIVIFSIVIAASYYIGVLLSSAWIWPWTKTSHLSMGTIDAFNHAGFPILGDLAFIIAFLGLMTGFLNLFSASSRLLFSLTRGNILPQWFSKVHPQYQTPYRATSLVLFLVLAIGWMGKGALIYFLDIGGFLIALAWAFNTLCLMKIRQQYPDLKAGFRNRYLLLPFLGGLGALIVALVSLLPITKYSLAWPSEYVLLVLWALLGLAVYLGSLKRPLDVQELLGSDILSKLKKNSQQ